MSPDDTGATGDYEQSSMLSRAHEEAIDRYRVRLRSQPTTPREWRKVNAHVPDSPAYREMLWAHYRLAYPPPRVPGFAIEDVLGEGGMGRVYLARDEKLKRMVALKELTRGLGTGTEAARFRQEAEIMAKLKHPNVVQVHQLVTADGREFIVMEHMPNGSLEDRLGSAEQLAAAPLLAKLSRAIDYVHRHKIVHRDLKPSNVLFDERDEPKVSDFGLAKDAEAAAEMSGGAVVGTAQYMAPEQTRGEIPTPATDIWAFGVILYRIFAGGYPFEGATVSELYNAIGQREPRPLPPDVPPQLAAVCRKCLRKAPAERYSSGQALAADLDTAGGAVSWKISRRAAVIGLAVTMPAVVGLSLWAWPFRLGRPIRPQVMRDKLPDPSKSIALSPDGRFGYCEVRGDTIVRYDLGRGQMTRQFAHGIGSPGDSLGGVVASSPDGKQLATLAVNVAVNLTVRGDERQSYLELIDADSLARHELSDGNALFGKPLVYSTDGKKLAVVTSGAGGLLAGVAGMIRTPFWGSDQHRVSVLDLETRTWHHLPTVPAVRCLAFSPDGTRLMSGGDDATLTVWDGVSGKELPPITVARDGVDAIAVSKDGSQIFVASIASQALTAYAVAGGSGKPISTAATVPERMTLAAVRPSGFALTAHGSKAFYWDVASGTATELARSGLAGLSAIALSADAKSALVADAELTVCLYRF